jgi:hypothetical protein
MDGFRVVNTGRNVKVSRWEREKPLKLLKRWKEVESGLNNSMKLSVRTQTSRRCVT